MILCQQMERYKPNRQSQKHKHLFNISYLRTDVSILIDFCFIERLEMGLPQAAIQSLHVKGCNHVMFTFSLFSLFYSPLLR